MAIEVIWLILCMTSSMTETSSLLGVVLLDDVVVVMVVSIDGDGDGDVPKNALHC